MDKSQEAVKRFLGGFNCSQSVLASFASEYGLTEELALKLASPFGGGMGHNGEACGAVSGALMVIGLHAGYIDPEDKEQKHAAYELSTEFLHRFREKHQSARCPDLLGLDIGVPEELQDARDRDLFHTRCPDFVRSAVEIIDEILDNQ
jgi:C_GCAxxG_C_C family probable redox protein